MDGLGIAFIVLGACVLGVIGSSYLPTTGTTRNPYDLTDQTGNTRNSIFNKYDPTPQAQGPLYFRGGSKRKYNKKNTTKRYRKYKG